MGTGTARCWWRRNEKGNGDLALLMGGAQSVVNALRTQEVGAHVHTLATGTQTGGD